MLRTKRLERKKKEKIFAFFFSGKIIDCLNKIISVVLPFDRELGCSVALLT